jgi:hypothetical protein
MRTRPRFSLFALLGIALAGCGGVAASPVDAALPMCTSTPVMPADTFCKIFVARCPLTIAGYTNMGECVASYSALTTKKPNKQKCQAYHLCQAVDYPAGADRDNHCGHATGFAGNQACEQED